MKIGELLGIGNTAKVYQWGKTEVIKIFYDHNSAMKEANHAELISSLNLRTPGYGGLVECEGKMGVVYERIAGPTMLWNMEPTEQSMSYHAKLMPRHY